MVISYISTIKVNNETMYIRTPVHSQVTYGQSNRFITVDDDVTLVQNPEMIGKLLGVNKFSVFIKWNGFPETAVIPIDIAKLIIKFVKQNSRFFNIMITNDESKDTWYYKKKGNIYKASMYQTMFDVNQNNSNDDFGGVMVQDAKIIESNKPLSFSAALDILNAEHNKDRDIIMVNNRGIMISKNNQGIVYSLKSNSCLDEPLIITVDIQKSSWYLCKDKIY